MIRALASEITTVFNGWVPIRSYGRPTEIIPSPEGTDTQYHICSPIISATTADAVREAANTLVDPAQFVRVVLLPAQP